MIDFGFAPAEFREKHLERNVYLRRVVDGSVLSLQPASSIVASLSNTSAMTFRTLATRIPSAARAELRAALLELAAYDVVSIEMPSRPDSKPCEDSGGGKLRGVRLNGRARFVSRARHQARDPMHSRHFRSRKLARAIAGILCVSSGALAPYFSGVYAQESEAEEEEDVTSLSGITVTDDSLGMFTDEPSASSFGFAKPLLETPRSVSFISEEQISMFGVSTVEDLTRLVPGTYTTTRYGLQGGINVRGVSSDMYYRGMKRLQMQGHVRTVLSAMDAIEIVKGPPSPIYGMGRIGGYQNMVPKSSRAQTGAYMPSAQGFIQTTNGSYNRNELQGGVGGPMRVFGKQGGYYVFGLLEDSDTYVRQVGAEQKFIQATVSLDDFVGPFRLEFGGQLQNSVTSGAYMNRVTQDLIDNGRYISGQPMVDMDLNGDGMIGYVESYTASPVVGNISSRNQALQQEFVWPTDANGNFVNISEIPKVPGIPQPMLDYLNAHPEIDCHAADVMRSMPAGGPVPASGHLPLGFYLNPCTVQVVPVDWRGNGSYEREQNADQKLAYIDFIYDANPDFTMKNQILYDNIDSFKDSFLPYGENQYIKAFENKFTVTKRISDAKLPGWVRINTLASLNYRKTSGWIRSSGGDFDYRQDIHFNGGYHYPNTMFWTQYSNPSYETGAPDTRWNSSEFDSTGLGVMFDIDILRNTNIVVGGRYDTSDARATSMATLNPNTGVSPPPGVVCTEPGPDCPGRYNAAPSTVEGSDSGGSWSISISHQLGPWRPYVTLANASLQLSGSNDIVTTNVVAAGHIGEAELTELGVKGSFLGGKLNWSAAAYEQTRTDVSNPDDPTAGADVSSTLAQGIETEIKWAPTRNLSLSGYFLVQDARLTVDAGDTLHLTARSLGFEDVLDPVTGEVLFPAEAFLYGGKATLELPDNQGQFLEEVTNPERQAGFNGTYTFGGTNLRVLFGATWFSDVWADRVRTLKLPEALVWNAGMSWDKGPWHIRVNGYNVSDERYFRARNSATNPNLVSVMPGTRWEFTAKHEFR